MKSPNSRTLLVVVSVVVLILGFLFGFLIGWVSKPSGSGCNQGGSCLYGGIDINQDVDSAISKKLQDEMKSENIREYLRDLTQKPHLGGTPADLTQAEELKQFWLDVGLDAVNLAPYDVLLSYPDPDNPNHIDIVDETGKDVYTSQRVEKIVRPEQDQPDVVPPFNAYSAPGTPKGELVYVNYGRVEDFKWLKDNTDIDLQGKILISRYGKIFRGSKAKYAEKAGAAGLILYTDPADYAVDGDVDVYPDSWWLPGTGVQRGTVNIAGDPLTPGYPAIASAYRKYDPDVNWLPSIPIHPVGYEDAKNFLENMAGDLVPQGWEGNLNISYRLGPGFQNTAWKIQMHISTDNKNTTTYNVIGYITGSVEPDRYVMIGNHRDAWVFGAMDPSSGTAAMMEVARAFGAMLKTGWRPRRTLMFCSWGAEEYGLVGSREWVEHYQRLLGERAVAYLNVDIAVEGNHTFRGKGMPLLEDLMIDVAKRVANPSDDQISLGRKNIYDTWLAHTPGKDATGALTGRPKVTIPGSGSDFEPFVTLVGVPCADLRYNYDSNLGISSYPLYHSVYETFHLVENFVDPQFKYHLAIAQYWGEMALALSDALILPFNALAYAQAVNTYAAQVKRLYGALMKENGLTSGLDFLNEAMEDFIKSATDFHNRLEQVNKQNPLEVRKFNDQFLQLERAFIDPLGLPNRPYTRHVVFAPSSKNSYAGSSFPALADSLFEIEGATADKVERWEHVKKQLSIITYFIQVATAVLAKVEDF